MTTTDLPSHRTSGAAYLPAGPELEPADESLPAKLPSTFKAISAAARKAEEAAEEARITAADALARAAEAAAEVSQYQRAEHASRRDRRRVALQEIVRATSGQLEEIERAKTQALADFTAAVADEPWALALTRWLHARHLFQVVDAAQASASAELTGERPSSWRATEYIALDGERLAELLAGVIDGQGRRAAVDWQAAQGASMNDFIDGRSERVELPPLNL